MKLQLLNDAEFAEAKARGELSGIGFERCPTCGSLRDEDGRWGNGVYRFQGREVSCDCSEQYLLRSHYLLANIPDQYIRLDWKRDFNGSDEIKSNIEFFIDKWSGFKINGMGVELAGKALGTGKTFAATTIGKELVKRGEKVFFLPFNQMLTAMRHNDEKILQKLDTFNVLILDEVQPPPDQPVLRNIFQDRFESIIRNRTNYNGVTIITTNMTQDEWEEHYPRIYSLYLPKRQLIEMKGQDARQSQIVKENLELIANEEVRPIS